jgi:chemotaxis protein MotB
MSKPDETIDLDVVPRNRPVVLPWLLFLAMTGLAGYFYWTVHRPLLEDAHKKDAALADLTKVVADAKRDADAARAAQEELAKTQEQLKQTQSDLAHSAEQKSEDDKLLAQLKKEVAGAGDVEGSAGQITLTMVDRILFKSGEATLTPEGEQVLRKLGGVLASVDKLVEVSGHADNQPIESQRKQLFPTNWELSVARATNVVRFLQDKVGIKPRRLKAAGYGSYRPVASNATPAGRAKNRRIEILLLPDKIKVVKGDFSDETAPVAEAHPRPPVAAEHPRPPVADARPRPAAKKHAK